MANNKVELTNEESQKLLQLAGEMKKFPPDHFEPENILAWSKFFNVAPKQLADHTSELSKTLNRAYLILQTEGAIS